MRNGMLTSRSIAWTFIAVLILCGAATSAWAAVKPDLMIKAEAEANAAFATDNTYEPTPSGDQVQAGATSSTIPYVYHVKVQNDGDETTTYCLKAVESATSGWTIVYKAGVQEITSAMLGAGYTTSSLAAGASQVITIIATSDNTAVSTSKDVTINAYFDSADETVRDSVKASASSNAWKAWYMAPTALGAGDGTSPENAFVFTTFINTTAPTKPAAVNPGDTIWMVEGTYNLPLNTTNYLAYTLVGTSAAPYKYRAMRGADVKVLIPWNASGQPAQLKITATANAGYIWLWGWELYSNPSTNRNASVGTAIAANSAAAAYGGVKFLNMLMHDLRAGPHIGTAAVGNCEVSGNLIYNCGTGSAATTHYAFKGGAGTGNICTLNDNIVFNNSYYGVHVYGFPQVAGNVIFQNGATNTGTVAHRSNFIIQQGNYFSGVITNNFFYFKPGVNTGNSLDGSGGTSNAPGHAFTYNTIIGSTGTAGYAAYLSLANTINNCTIIGRYAGTANFTNNTLLAAKPVSGLTYYARVNGYEPSRGEVVVLNWDNAASTGVDISPISGLQPGDAYEVIDAQNPLGDAVAAGVYDGGNITLPLQNTAVAAVVGTPCTAAVHTPSEFNVFIVRKTDTAPGNYNLTVRSTPIQGVTITGDQGGVTNYSVGVAADTEVTLTAPATAASGDLDYAFVRWTGQADGVQAYTFTVTGDMVVTAEYTIVQRNLNVISSPVTGVAITGAPAGATNYSAQVNDNSNVSLTAPTIIESGGNSYNFSKWVLNGVDQTGNPLAFTIGADSTAEAVFTQISSHTLTVNSTPVAGAVITGNPSSAGGTTNYSCPVEASASVTLTAAATMANGWVDYTFARWTGQSDGVQEYTFTVDADMTVTAEYTIVQRNLEVDSTPIAAVEITGSPAGATNYSATLDDGSAVSLTAPTPVTSGGVAYEFNKWTLNGADQAGNPLAFAIQADSTAVAVYTIVKRSLAVESTPITGVVITGDPAGTTNYAKQVDDQSNVSLTAPATVVSGGISYGFVTWTGQTPGELTYSFVIGANVTATAEYSVTQRALTVNSTPVTGVEITGTLPDVTNYSVVIDDGSEVILTAPTSVNIDGVDYFFSTWTGHAAGVNSITFTVSGDLTKTAEYALVPSWQIDVVSTPVSGADITGGNPGATNYYFVVLEGTNVSLTAPATFIAGGLQYGFLRWTGQTPGEATYSFTVSGNATVTAEYEEIALPRADLLVKAEAQANSLYAIAHEYQKTPSGNQIESQTTSATIPAVYHVKIVHDGTLEARSYVLKAVESVASGWTVAYMSGLEDITADMLGAGFTTDVLTLGASQVITVVVTADNTAVSTSKDVTINAYNDELDATVRDSVLLATSANAYKGWYMAPTALGAGDGTSPANAFAFSQFCGAAPVKPAAVNPGDTIWMVEGVYNPTFSSGVAATLSGGTSAAPYTYRAMNGKSVKVVIPWDTTGTTNKISPVNYTRIWGWEICSVPGSGQRNLATGMAIGIYRTTSPLPTGLKIINSSFHDLYEGIYLDWQGTNSTEISGNLFYNGGTTGATNDYPIYAGGQDGNRLTVKDNVIFNNYHYAFVPVNYVDAVGNVSFQNGSINSPAALQSNVRILSNKAGNVFDGNCLYFVPEANAGVSFDDSQGANQSLSVINNWIIGSASTTAGYAAYINTVATVTGNTIVGRTGGSASFAGNTLYPTTKPTGTNSLVRVNAWEPSRGQVVVLNWDNLASANVTVSAISGLQPGDAYEVCDAQNPAVVVAIGTFGGTTINLPLQNTAVAAVVGSPATAAAHTPSEFNVFIVKKLWVAKYGLDVQSTPVQSVGITGSHPGLTNYSVVVEEGSAVALTVPASVQASGSYYDFVRWIVNQQPQAEGVTEVSFTMSSDTTVVAEYEEACPACAINGSGIIQETYGRATLFVDVRRSSDGLLLADTLRFTRLRPRQLVISTGISDLHYSGGATATISGACTLNGASGYTYACEITDNSPDRYSLVVKDSSQNVVVNISGNISVGGFNITEL